MYKKLKYYLEKPFPMLETKREKIGISFNIGFFVSIFLLIFQPFGIGVNTNSIALIGITLGYGLITFFSVAITTIFLPVILPNFFNPDKWSIKHHLILSFVNLALIAIGNWTYSIILSDDVHHHTLTAYLFNTLAVGFFPVIFSVLFYDNKFSNKNKHIADETNSIINARKIQQENTEHHFKSAVKSESISLFPSDIVCIKAEGNYCNFFFIKDKVLTKELLRIPLKLVEEELDKESKIMRCHRSWLINIDKVQSLSGTARNITLTMEYCKFLVPVSRNYANIVTKVLRHI